MRLDDFAEIWFVDFEFHVSTGNRPQPLCVVAREFRSGRLERRWLGDEEGDGPPYRTDADVLFVAYYSSAELGCHLTLDWPFPVNVLDLFPEFRSVSNADRRPPGGDGLLGALAWFGLDTISAVEKEEFRQLAIRGGPYSREEQKGLLDYCQSDVDSLAVLFRAMAPSIDLPRALLRGRFMASAARMEWNGIPLDAGHYHRMVAHWEPLKERLVEAVDSQYGVYDGTTFKHDRWAEFVARHGIPWPRLESGGLALDDDTFRQMSKKYPKVVSPVRELRHTLGQLRRLDLAVGDDGRNRCLLSAFRSKTGRNQPSNTRFIFGPSVWLRGLIKPSPGWAIAHVDWDQQEFAIAARLSCDLQMQEAYRSGDPYLEFAKQAGAIPSDGTREEYEEARERFKLCALGVQYGMGEKSLAANLGESPGEARQLLQLHRRTYPNYWAWSQAAVDQALLSGSLCSVFGWPVHIRGDANPRSLANFPCQSNGAEMMRLACIATTERGIRVCAPIHDALLVEAPCDEIDHVVAQTQDAMRQASEAVLSGFALRSDAKIFRYPNRFMDERGVGMWKTVDRLLNEIAGSPSGDGQPATRSMSTALLTG
jgi:hypothetical protein